jgi:phospholipase/lecithinase/hemolysin
MKQIERNPVWKPGVRALLVLTLTGILIGLQPVSAASQPFSRIFVFGDSLSDTGNYHALTGGLIPPPSYADGRFSNGPLWVEYLADHLGMALLPHDNKAVGGATTGFFNSNNGLFGQVYPGLQHQIEAFLADTGPAGADPEALYVVWAGANDFFVLVQAGLNPEQVIHDGVSNTVQAIWLLRQAGARHFLVLNVPDLGLTPFGLWSGESEGITTLVAIYNQFLAAALQDLGEAGIPTIHVDAFAVLQAMVNFPEDFGFTDVTQPLLSTDGEPAQFLFWDTVHPTTRGHEVLAGAARDRLLEYYSPSRGQGNPSAQIHSLRGLVRANRAR